MKIKAAIKEYLIEIEVRKYSPRTLRTYRNNLNLFLRFCGEWYGEGMEGVRIWLYTCWYSYVQRKIIMESAKLRAKSQGFY